MDEDTLVNIWFSASIILWVIYAGYANFNGAEFVLGALLLLFGWVSSCYLERQSPPPQKI